MNKLVTLLLSIFSVMAAIFGLKWAVPYDPSSYENADGFPSYVTEGEIRVELLSDSIVRIEQKGERGFENRPSFVVSKRDGWEKVDYTTENEDGFVVIKTESYCVRVPENAQNVYECTIESADGDTLWTYETQSDSAVYLPSPSEELKSWSFNDSPRVIPSEDGYSVSKTWHNLNGWDLTNKADDIFVFLPGGDYKKFTSDFVELTGRSEMITLNLLGYWDSRYYEYTDKTAMKQIEDYESRGYPLDVLVIDTDWRLTTSGTGYTVNPKLFPNMKRFLSDVHDKGVSVVFNDHPQPLIGTKNVLDTQEIIYRNTNLKKLLSKGLDYWWYDRNWWTTLKNVDPDLSRYATGMYVYHDITEKYYKSVSDGEFYRRPLIMANVDGIDNGYLSRPSSLAAHRYTLQWTGDIASSEQSLSDEIFNTVFSGAEMGLPYISSDIGGHSSEVSPDMYVRWMQYGALSPICRVHCTKPYSRMPWLYGDTAEEVTHNYVDMRYRLLPIYYSLAHENYETGLPIARRLDIEYPQYAEADRNDEYLLSDNILVAPLAQSYPETNDYKFTSGGNDGLKAEYFSNDSLSGTPDIVRYEKDVNFNWGYGAPNGLNVSDYFSVRFTGQLTVGDSPLFFRAYADDGVRVWIDSELVIDGWDVYDKTFTTSFLQPDSVHDIKVEYFDKNNDAHIYLTAYSDGEVERSVFIPDGEWIDIWTGETYAGPDTITVSHSLETSPVFVRAGSVLTLADNMKNTNEKDWSHLTLEVFPSADKTADSTLYEDDVTTVAYKSGEFRTTDITLSGDRTQTLVINPAEGKFSGERAFASRDYTLRVHAPKGWGKLNSASLNGKNVDFKLIEQDKNASPLAIIGGARDSDVYELTFSTDVYERSEVKLTFENSVNDKKNDRYNSSDSAFLIKAETLDKNSDSLTIEDSAKDYILYGLNWEFETAQKNGNFTSDIVSRGKKDLFDDNYTITYTTPDSQTKSTTCGVVSYKSLTTVLKSDGNSQFKLYVGGFRSIASLTVRDRAGNTKTVYFGDTQSNYYKEITIDSFGAGDLEVTYDLESGNNITAAACVVY